MIILCCPVSVLAKNKNSLSAQKNHRLLFISSYSYNWSTVPLQIEGIQSKLDSNISLDIEFMDTKQINTKIAEQLLYDKLCYKEQHDGEYDAIIVGDDAALVLLCYIRMNYSTKLRSCLRGLIILNMPKR